MPLKKSKRSPMPNKRGSSGDALTTAPIDLTRHTRECTICAHSQREEIERDFITWTSTAAITRRYKLGDRRKMVRHAHAFGLFAKRQRNVRASLEKIIEKAGEVPATAAAVVMAVQAYAKINAQGQWIDRTEVVNLNELFERMTTDEMEAYARDGKLPGWFRQVAQPAEETNLDAERTRN